MSAGEPDFTDQRHTPNRRINSSSVRKLKLFFSSSLKALIYRSMGALS